MLTLVEMDKRVSIFAQMQQEAGPLILINTFTVDPAEVGQLLLAWTDDADFMKRQPGCISIQLHRGIGGSSVFTNYVVWESASAFRAAFSQPVFQESLGKYPASAVAAPHLFQKVAVPGICLG
jgi:quinol monooxygenase YgiN